MRRVIAAVRRDGFELHAGCVGEVVVTDGLVAAVWVEEAVGVAPGAAPGRVDHLEMIEIEPAAQFLEAGIFGLPQIMQAGVDQASSGSLGLMEISESWTRLSGGVPAALVTSVPSGVWLRRRRPAVCCWRQPDSPLRRQAFAVAITRPNLRPAQSAQKLIANPTVPLTP